ncbi:MAG: TonB-dependent receptor [Lacunisphaera sp.]
MSVSTPYSLASLLPKLAGGFLFSLALCAQAQVAPEPAAPSPAASPAAPAPTSDKVVTLSPFVVNTGKDQGFVATSSLAGGRLATDLKDTAAAYTVLTKEFVDAVGITSLADANKWTVNSSAADDDGGNMLIFRSVLANTRGVANNGNYRNFFPSTFYPDGFNIDRYDFARGPNAVLFGAGSIGGSPNVVTKQAVLGKGFTELRTVVGSWDNSRSTIDVNVPMGEKVALRVNALYQDKGGWRQNDFDDKKALHLTSQIELTRHTQVNVEGEWGSFQRNTAFTTINDRVSGWDGTTVFATGPSSIATALANSSSANRLGNPYILISPALTGSDQVFSFGNATATRGGNESAAIPVGGVLVTSPLSASIGTRGLLYALNEPSYEDRLKNILNSPLVPQVTKDFFRNLGPEFTTTLDIPGNTYQYRTFSASINQQVGDNWFFEGAVNYLKELGKSELMDRGQMPVIRLDLVQTLPDGRPNPGFLQPYGEEPRTVGSNDDLTINYRAAAAYVRKGTRFGDFMLNVLGGLQHRVDKQRRYIYTLTGLTTDPRTWGQTSTINGVSVDPRIRYRYYWTINTPGNRGVPELSDPLTVNINGKSYTGTPAWMVDTTTLANTLDNTTDFSYLQSALNWKVWDGKLNFFAAVRHDNYESETLTPPPLGTDAVYGPGWNGQTIPFRPSAPSNYFDLTSAQQALYSTPKISTGVTTESFGGVFHVLPWLSVFADHATSFNPNGAGRTITGALFAPQKSDGTDVGLRFSFFGDRLTGSFLRYTGNSANELISTGTAAGLLTDLPTAINNIINANPIGDGSPSNIRGLAAVPIGYFDRRAREAKGYELEVTGNLTRQWRLLANLGVPDAVQADAYADTRAYLATNDTVLRQILGDAGVTVGANDVAAVNPVASNDAAAAATAWNNLQSFKQTVIADPQKVTRLPKFTANLFTDYTFDHGAIRGLKFGAGVNYRGREVIGNKGADVIANPSAPAQSIDDPSASPLRLRLLAGLLYGHRPRRV